MCEDIIVQFCIFIHPYTRICIYIKQYFFLLPSHPLKTDEGGLRNVDNSLQPMQPHPEEVWTATVACPQPGGLARGRSLGGGSACTWGRMTPALSMSLCKPKPSKGRRKAQQLSFEGHPKLLGVCFFCCSPSSPLASQCYIPILRHPNPKHNWGGCSIMSLPAPAGS